MLYDLFGLWSVDPEHRCHPDSVQVMENGTHQSFFCLIEGRSSSPCRAQHLSGDSDASAIV